MNILHIDSSILGDNSVSRSLTAKAVARYAGPDATVTYRDLALTPLSHLTGEHFAARALDPAERSPAQAAELAAGEAALDEFLAADVIVVGAPMYNFSIPSQLKAWIDRVSVNGRTFRYTADGPEGLAKGKKLVIVSSRGGVYSEGAAKVMDHQESYLGAVFGFLGITDIELVRAEGVNISPEQRRSSVEAAEAALARALPKAA